jgi:hypothetical protein
MQTVHGVLAVLEECTEGRKSISRNIFHSQVKNESEECVAKKHGTHK